MDGSTLIPIAVILGITVIVSVFIWSVFANGRSRKQDDQ